LLDLKDLGIDLTGFDMCEIDDLLSGIDIQVGLTDVGAVPDVLETATSQLGDTWACDKHRVRCGDATKKDDVNQVPEGRPADMVFCDPPYSVSYTGKTARKLTIKNDDLGAGFYDFLRDACANVLAVTTGAISSAFPHRSCTHYSKHSPKPVATGRRLLSGRRTTSR
jgi:hypothetical protein